MGYAEYLAAQYEALINNEANTPDKNRGPLLLRVCWALNALSAIVVCARLWVKVRKTRRLYWDDGLMVLALVFAISFSIMVTITVGSGLGRHFFYLTTQERVRVLHIGVFVLGWAFLSPMFGRMSFCITLLYLTGTDPRVKKWPIWMFFALQAAVNISTVIVFCTQCGTHLDYIWHLDQSLKYSEHCGDPRLQTYYGYFQGSFNTVTDLFLSILPFVLIEHTKLSRKSKTGLALCLCLSIVAMVASIVKTYEAKALSSVVDYTYSLAPYTIWLSIELNVVMIVSSVPFLRPLLGGLNQRRFERQLAQKWDTSTVGSVFSKKGPRAKMSRINSEEDEEGIISPQGGSYPPIEMQQVPSPGIIQVTTEVAVTYQSSNSPYVHAALVGLVYGEIANPKLVQR